MFLHVLTRCSTTSRRLNRAPQPARPTFGLNTTGFDQYGMRAWRTRRGVALLHVLGSLSKLRTEILIIQNWPTNKTASSSLSSQFSNCPSSHRVRWPLVPLMILVGFSSMHKRSWHHRLDKVRLAGKWSLA